MIAYISEKANKELSDHLKSLGVKVNLVKKHAAVQEGISCHPDIYYCSLPEGDLFEGDAELLSSDYPGDVLYNACVVGKYFICSKYTSESLIDICVNNYGLQAVIVPQGYVKCNLCVVDDTHVITEDEGIRKALEGTDIECLLIEKGFVSLPGYKYGFIGGATGRVGDVIIFNGDLSVHPSFDKIVSFIEGCGLKVKYFSSYGLADIGSVIVEYD